MLRQRDILTVKTVTLCKKLYFFMKSLKSKKKKLALTSFYCLSRELGFSNSWKLNSIGHSRFCNFWHSVEFKNIFQHNFKVNQQFNNKPPASWFVYITGDILTRHSCSYYSSMLWNRKIEWVLCFSNSTFRLFFSNYVLIWENNML